MDNRPIKVSVIVLTYNHEKYIRQALDSILMQKVDFRYEILVGDDASSDGTTKILQEYQQKYGDIFRLFLRSQNVGATRNSYELLTNAKGTYLATCEGDDYWTDTDKLQMQVKFLEEHLEFVGTSHRFTIVDGQGNPVKKQSISWVKFKKQFTIEDFSGIYLPGQPSTFVRRNIFLKGSMDFSIIYRMHPMIADRTLMLIFLFWGNFYSFSRSMSCYRCRVYDGNSLTTKLYRTNEECIEMDYDFNDRLEKYASTLFGKKIVFQKRRKQLFSSAIFSFLRVRNKHSVKLIIRMLKESTSPLFLLLSTPFYTVKKAILKLVEL